MGLRPIHVAPRGATLRLFVEVYQDTDSLIDGTEIVRAVLKFLSASNPQADLPGDDAAISLTCSVAWQAASGGNLAGWHITGAAADTDALTPGFYATDLRIVLDGGEVEYAEPIAIDLRQHVTRAA